MFTRRLFFTAAGSALWVPAALQAHPGHRVFTLGVTSGAPRDHSVVLWTRLAPDPLRGGGMPDGLFEVRYRVGTDPGLKTIVREGIARTTHLKGHSVHVRIDGLEPGREYFYQFVFGEEESTIGRTRTSDPSAGTAKIALANCQSYETGYYAAYRDMAEWAPDCVIHVGDYVYEGIGRPLGTQRRTYGGEVFEWTNVRQHTGPETVTLYDYRNRYAQYRLDPALQAAHAASPWIVAMDDHEVDNNWAGMTPQDPEKQTSAEFALRRKAALQAYYEHMPLEHAPGFGPIGGGLQLYGGYRFGPADVSLLDTRQFRSDQVCGGGFPSEFPCAELEDPRRTMTGAEQEAWLLRRIETCQAPIHILAQQTWFAPFRYDEDPGARLWNMDQWDGYPVQRRRITEALAGAQAEPLVLSGDWHCAAAMALHRDPEDPSSPRIGSNLAATSIASICPWYPSVKAAEAINSHVRYTNGNDRGYLRIEAKDDAVNAVFRTVDDVADPESRCSTDAEMTTADI